MDHTDTFSSTVAGVPAVTARATGGNGVHGLTSSNKDSAVFGEHTGQGVGVVGNGVGGGVMGQNTKGSFGVLGNGAGEGVLGQSTTSNGVHGLTSSNKDSAVFGEHTGQGIGVYGKSTGGPAGFFEGNVTVTGDITLTNADCAEEFVVAATGTVEPGTVMVLDQLGALQPSQQAYDKKVAGVISGAGDYRPGLILDKKETSEKRVPVALVGKVYCKVDAQYASIEVGDLLTTSPTPGHAMKAEDPLKAFGAVIGKALRPLQADLGLIPILIALQ